MQLDSDHPGAGSQQRRRQRPATGPEIQHEIAGVDTRPCNDAAGRSRIKTVVAPPPLGFPRGGHDAP